MCIPTQLKYDVAVVTQDGACRGKKRWILMVPIRGEIWMDEGAVRAVRSQGKSLFSAGIARVVGRFGAQDCVLLCDAEGNAFAQGLSNYSHSDVFNLKVSLID